MFGGKREKILEQELLTIKEEHKKKEKFISELCKRREGIEERFAQMTASRSQMEQDMKQVSEHLSRTEELAKSATETVDSVHSTIMEVNNAVGTFDVNHSVFLRQVKKQNETLKEMVENNRELTSPMEYITEFAETAKEEQTVIRQRIDEMLELSKQMGVLALKAAIEAGRLGKSGMNFMKAAEAIKGCAEKYEEAALGLSEQTEQSAEGLLELLEQTAHLSASLKENHISMGKLQQEGMKNTVTYEVGQIPLREALKEDTIKRVDELQQEQQEASRLWERMGIQLSDIRDECTTQKEYTNELERIYKQICEEAKKA